MKDFFTELFEYNFNYSQEVIKYCIESENKISEKTINLLNHTINAQQIWNERILNKVISCNVWEIRPLKILLDINTMNYHQSIEILSSKDILSSIEYKNSKGIHFSNVIKDILFHIINHSTYHRGQIMSELKANGITPIITDYIFYKRNYNQ